MNTDTQYVFLLREEDINENGKFTDKLLNSNKVLLFIQSPNCGHCRDAKDAVHTFAKKYYLKNNRSKGVIVLTLVLDETIHPDFKEVRDRLLKRIPPFQGVPHYVKFINGIPVSDDLNNRSLEGLENFMFNI
jgi:thiol-disulfide isomerase/thioredoxin